MEVLVGDNLIHFPLEVHVAIFHLMKVNNPNMDGTFGYESTFII